MSDKTSVVIDYVKANAYNATHYDKRAGELYKASGDDLLILTDIGWSEAEFNLETLLPYLTPIPSEEYNYEQVKEFSFDLRGAFENGELYFQHLTGWDKITDNEMFLTRMFENRVYRRIKKPEADWKTYFEGLLQDYDEAIIKHDTICVLCEDDTYHISEDGMRDIILRVADFYNK